MNRVDRLLGIITLLQSKKYVPAEKIADKYNISVRTVYRDIKSLSEQGIPVSFEPHKGYFIVPGYFLPPVSFTSDEANAMLLMESLVRSFADKSIKKHYSNALGKIKSVLHPTQKEKLEALNQNIKHQVPERFHHNFEYLSGLQHAISGKTVIDISYKNTKEETSERRVEPIGLIFYAFNWHLVAWCRKRNDYRDFRVSRIINLQQTSLPFQKTNHIELHEYMKQLPVPW